MKKAILLSSIFLFLLLSCNSGEKHTNLETKPTTHAEKTPPKKTRKEIPVSKIKPINSNLSKITQKTDLAVGKINGRPMVKIKTPLQVNGNLEINGWAIDKNAKLPAGAVFVLVNGIQFRANYGFGRNDVAVKYKNENLIRSGFKITIPYDKIPKGAGVIKFKVVTNNLKSYYDEALNYGFKYVK